MGANWYRRAQVAERKENCGEEKRGDGLFIVARNHKGKWGRKVLKVERRKSAKKRKERQVLLLSQEKYIPGCRG